MKGPVKGPALRLVPSSLYGPARRLLTPRTAGLSTTNHVALTFDDGPDPRSTPAFIDLLARHGVTATFFLIGERADRHPDVVAALAGAGHELAVHGWTHRCVARLRPAVLRDDLLRTKQQLESLDPRSAAGAVGWYRPPFGIATVSSTAAAAKAGLTPLLWSAWGRDWTRSATPTSIERTVQRTLRPGGTVLLHDSDAYSTPGSWRLTLAATDQLLDRWHAAGLEVGPVRDHGLGDGASRPRPTRSRSTPMSHR